MEKKIKFILIGLAALLAISLFVNLQIQAAKKGAERERDELKNENASLNKKIEEALKDNQHVKEQINTLTGDLEKVSLQKDELQKQKEETQKQYELIVKEKDELLDKLKKAQEAKEAKTEDTYWAGILKAKTELELQAEKVNSDFKLAKIKNEELEREKSSLGLDLKNLIREKDDLEQRYNYNQKTFDSMASELTLEKNTRRQLQDNLKSIKDENKILRNQLRSLGRRKVGLESQLVKLKEEKSGLERRFNEMALLLENRLLNISDIKQQLDAISSGSQAQITQPKKESVELPPIRVYPQSRASAEESPGAFLGTIMTVDKDNNFVVIDLGEDSGVKVNDRFKVYRQGKAIADIEAIQVRKDIAACDIKKEIAPIEAGDAIR